MGMVSPPATASAAIALHSPAIGTPMTKKTIAIKETDEASRTIGISGIRASRVF